MSDRKIISCTHPNSIYNHKLLCESFVFQIHNGLACIVPKLLTVAWSQQFESNLHETACISRINYWIYCILPFSISQNLFSTHRITYIFILSNRIKLNDGTYELNVLATLSNYTHYDKWVKHGKYPSIDHCARSIRTHIIDIISVNWPAKEPNKLASL